MGAYRKDIGFIIDIYGVDGLSTLIKSKELRISSIRLNRGNSVALKKIISDLKNPKNIASQKIKFVLIRVTQWTLLNASLNDKNNDFTELFLLITKYPHVVYVYTGLLKKRYSVISKLRELNIPQRVHIIDLLVNFREYDKSLDIKNTGVNEDGTIYRENISDAFQLDFETYNKKQKYNSDFWHIKDYRKSVKAYKNSPYVKSLFNQEDFVSIDTLENKLNCFIDHILKNDMNIITYSDSDDISLNVIDYINNAINKTFFELYINSDDYLSTEFDKFIDLFKYYLNKIKKINFDIGKESNETSVIYKFRSTKLSKQSFYQEFTDFKYFVEVAEFNPESIINQLSHKSEDNERNTRIIKDILKEWKRIKVDVQISFDRRMIDFKEYVLNMMLDSENNASINLLKKVNNNPFDQLSSKLTPNIINIYNNGSIKNFNNDVRRIITGKKIIFNDNDAKLLNYFNKYANSDTATQLQKNLEEIKDTNTSKSRKKLLITRVTSFLYKYAEKIGEKGLDKLFAYVAGLILNNN